MQLKFIRERNHFDVCFFFCDTLGITESFLTDTEISAERGVNGQIVEKELEEWTVDAEDLKVDHSLEAGGDMVRLKKKKSSPFYEN